MPQFLRPSDEIDKHRHHLPHWQQNDAWIFLTWRLADALPHLLLRRFRHARRIWLERNPEPCSEATKHEYRQRFSSHLEELLDNGHGSCALRDPVLAGIVADALRQFDGQR